VRRLVGALRLEGEASRNGGSRPMMEQLRRLLTRNARLDGDAENLSSDTTVLGEMLHGSSPQLDNIVDSGISLEGVSEVSGNVSSKNGKKIKTINPIKYGKKGSNWQCLAPPKIKLLLGYGKYDQDSCTSTNNKHHSALLSPLSSNVPILAKISRYVLSTIFRDIAEGRSPTKQHDCAKLAIETNQDEFQTLTWSLPVFSNFIRHDIKICSMPAEEWILFSKFSSVEYDRSKMKIDGFLAFITNLCKDARKLKCLWSYLQSLGYSG